MKRILILLTSVVCFASPTLAEGLLDKVKRGADSAVSAAERGATSVGDAVGKGVDAVDQSIKSTNELLREEETPEATRAKLDAMADGAISRLRAENPDANNIYDISAGYAAFDTRSLTIFPLSAGYGRGVAISAETGARTYMQMGTGGVGAAFGIGGFESQFVIMFETQADFDTFTQYGYDASANAGAMTGDDRTTEAVQFIDGRSFFVLDKKGWRVNANATGTKYWKDADLNE